jgi:hypothetical protein
MTLSTKVKRVAIAAAFVAELALMAGIAFAASDLPEESVFVGADDVVIEAYDQQVFGAVAVARVVSPVDGWVVLRADWGTGVPAEVIGAAPVSQGENTDVAVVLDPSRDLPPGAFVLVVADRGMIDAFEYTTGDPEDAISLEGVAGMSMSVDETETDEVIYEAMDWPLVAGDEIVTKRIGLTPFKVAYRQIDADIDSTYLDATETSALIFGVDAPSDSWVVIIQVAQTEDDQNEVLGFARVPAGHTERLDVPIARARDGFEVTALLVADLGAPGVLEIDASLPVRSVDAPYIVRSWFVWKRATPAH